MYVTDEFEKLMHKAKLDDDVIVKVANELNNGLHDGELQSGSLYKKRIPSPGQGKRESNRSVIAIQKGDRLFFIDGWRKKDVPKKGKEIPDKLMETYKLIGDSFLSFTDEQIEQNILDGLLREVRNDG
nr:type II toxin-antitoxin system RelE/ParE family toxin [Shewanella canadensis]